MRQLPHLLPDLFIYFFFCYWLIILNSKKIVIISNFYSVLCFQRKTTTTTNKMAELMVDWDEAKMADVLFCAPPIPA